MSKRNRDRKKVAKLRKQRTIDNIEWRKAWDELGNGRNQSHPFNDVKKEGRVEFEVQTGVAPKV